MGNSDITKSDNIKDYIARANVVEGTFTADDGRVIEYSHLHISFLVNGQKFVLKAKLSAKDLLLLSMAQPVGSQDFLGNESEK